MACKERIDCLGTCNFEEVEDSKHWDGKYLCYAQETIQEISGKVNQ